MMRHYSPVSYTHLDVYKRQTLVLVTHDVQLANRCQRQLKLERGVLNALVAL